MKLGSSARILLRPEDQCDGDFNNIGSISSADSNKTNENVPLTEFYEGLDEKLDDGDDYDPSVKDEGNKKSPVSKKNKLNVSRLTDNKGKYHPKNVCCSKGIDSN